MVEFVCVCVCERERVRACVRVCRCTSARGRVKEKGDLQKLAEKMFPVVNHITTNKNEA